MTAPPLYALDGIGRTFLGAAGPIAALDGISLRIEEGEALAVTGPSGAGKSTLLAILGGLDGGATGTLRFRGSELGLSSPDLRLAQIGWVFQGIHLLPYLDVRHNVALPYWKLHGNRARALARAEVLLGDLGLADHLDAEVAHLSGGEMQRVALARALVNDPAVILADEPTAHLDAEGKAAVTRLLHEAHGRGTALVVSTHDAELAASLPRQARLRHGRLEAAGA